MSRPALLAALLAVAACEAVPSPPADAGTCAPPVPCFAACEASSPLCVAGTLDAATCRCLGADGPREWPEPAVLESLTLAEPLPARVAVDRPLHVKVRARFAGGGSADVTLDATFTVEPAGAVDEVGRGLFVPSKIGGFTITFSFTHREVTTSVAVSSRALREEARALWITR